MPAHKKERKNLIKSFLPISLLHIFGNVFERVAYVTLFLVISSVANFLHLRDQVSSQVHCIAELVSVIHEIPTAFDSNPTVDVRGEFLYIYEKAFDKVWHNGILFKLKSCCVEYNY